MNRKLILLLIIPFLFSCYQDKLNKSRKGQLVALSENYLAQTTDISGEIVLSRRDNLNWKEFQIIETSLELTSISLSDQYLVASSYTDNNNTGSAIAYYLEDESITKIDDLVPNNLVLAENDRFGYAISLSRTIILVGAPGRAITSGLPPVTKSECGSVFAFKINNDETGVTVEQDSVIRPDEPVEGGLFGYSVSINDFSAAIGSPGVNNRQGAAYNTARVIPPLKWTDFTEFKFSENSAGDMFGSSVGINGRYFVVGAPMTNQGYAVVYKAMLESDSDDITSWELHSVINSEENIADAQFANKIDLDLKHYMMIGYGNIEQVESYFIDITESKVEHRYSFNSPDGREDIGYGDCFDVTYILDFNSGYAIINAPEYKDEGQSYIIDLGE